MTVPPDETVLRQFFLGELPPKDLESVARYLETHPELERTLDALAANDTLVSSLRKAPAEPESPEVTRLIEQISALTGTPTPSEADPLAATTPPDALPAKDEATLPPDNEFSGLLSPPVAPGELGWLGGYRVLRELGRGGMGLVFEAEEVQLGRRVALKVMSPTLAASPTAKKRFVQEAKTASAVEHDHIIPIYRIGEDRGVPFLAMPLLIGDTLEDRLRGRKSLAIPDVLVIGRQIAEGLAAAHAAGLIHRDIKPSNIWLERTPTGEFRRVKILDFGLARLATGSGEHITRTGAIMGTPAYMAPEQARGLPVDHRADLFSLGAVLYQMTTGRRPFSGSDTLAILTALATETPAAPSSVNPDVPPALSELVMLLLTKDADTRRPATAREVAEELGRIAAPPVSPSASAEPAMPTQPPARGRKRPWLWGVAAALLFGALGLGAAYGPTIIRIANNEGELLVEVDDLNIEVVVKGTSVEILDPNGKRYLVSAGKDGEIEIREKGTEIVLVVEKFRVKRGDKTVVTVTNDRLAAARQPKPIPPAVPTPAPKSSAGDSPPAKDAFPGELVFYDTFDDPNACLLPLRTAGPVRSTVRDGQYSMSAQEGKANGSLFQNIVLSSASEDSLGGAFTIRMRVRNSETAWVNFRARFADASEQWLCLNVLPEGLWTIARAGQKGSGGKFELIPGLPRTFASSDKPAPELAAGKWVTISARWAHDEYELWLNGNRVAGSSIADLIPVKSFRKSHGIQVGIKLNQDGPAGFDLDYTAVWKQPSSVGAGPASDALPAKDAFPGELLVHDACDDPKTCPFDLKAPGASLKDGAYIREYPLGGAVKKWEPVGRPTRDAAIALRVRTTDLNWSVMFRECTGPRAASYVSFRAYTGGAWSLDRVTFVQEGQALVPQPLLILAKSNDPVPEVASGRWVNLVIRAEGDIIEVALNGKRIAAVRDPGDGGLTVKPSYGALSLAVDPQNGKPGRFEVDSVAVWDLSAAKLPAGNAPPAKHAFPGEVGTAGWCDGPELNKWTVAFGPSGTMR